MSGNELNVSIKPLEWVDGAPGTYKEVAESPFGHYSVWEINGTACWAPWRAGSGSIVDGGIAGAKAAAQADYEARIRSALSPQPVKSEPMAWVYGPKGDEEFCIGPRKPTDNAIPLYTSPQPVTKPAMGGEGGEFRPTYDQIEYLQEALEALGLFVDGDEALNIFATVFSTTLELEKRHVENIVHTRTERAAKAVYDSMPYDGAGEKPGWVNGGNSIKQEEARRYARASLCTTAFAMAKGES